MENQEFYIPDELPLCYKYKVELVNSCIHNMNTAKVIGIYTSSFPFYSRYFGGNYVAS